MINVASHRVQPTSYILLPTNEDNRIWMGSSVTEIGMLCSVFVIVSRNHRHNPVLVLYECENYCRCEDHTLFC